MVEGKPPLFPDPVNPDPGDGTPFKPRTPRAPRPQRRGRTWKQRLLVGSGLLVVLAVLAAGGVIGYGWWRWSQVGKEKLALAAPVGAVQNYLIVGSDSRDNVNSADVDINAFVGGNEETGGERSDTIMVVRVDPKDKTIDMLSFPRDLWVEVAGTGGHERINTAYGLDGGAQRLIDTLKLNFGIDINHYVAVDFSSFKGVVDAVGGVPLYFETPMRDRSSGLAIEEAGCTKLDGVQALAFSRARHLEYQNANGKWIEDPTADLGRISRQQQFIRKMIDRAAASTKGFDLRAMNSIIGSTADNLTIDSGLNLNDVMGLAKDFRDFHGDQIVTHTLPVESFMTKGGASVLKLDEAGAQASLNVFRGRPADATTITPSQVTLAIENGSGRAGEAGVASRALTTVGFTVEGTGDAPAKVDRSIVRYAPGSALKANQVLMHLAAGGTLQVDDTLAAGEIVLVTGTDFTSIATDALDVPPVEDDAASVATTTTSVDPNVISGPVGIVPKEPTDGTVCAP